MVVTSEEKDQHIANLKELLRTITKYNLKINPNRCVFGVKAGKFLGFLLTERDIDDGKTHAETTHIITNQL